MMQYPDLADTFLQHHSHLLCESFRHWTGKPLIITEDPGTRAASLFNADFVLVSHGTGSMPVFNYANRRALDLFEMDWDAFTRMPSRQSADQDNQEARAELMERVRAEGIVTGCSGIRVTHSGRRFRIDDATVWNILDNEDRYRGQAAMFERWYYL